MHLDKLIELFDKRVLLFGTDVERSVLEHLLRLRYLEALKPKEERKPAIYSLVVLANEVGNESRTVYNLMRDDENAPKKVPSPDGKRKRDNYYVRDEFYVWWNNRKKYKS